MFSSDWKYRYEIELKFDVTSGTRSFFKAVSQVKTEEILKVSLNKFWIILG